MFDEKLDFVIYTFFFIIGLISTIYYLHKRDSRFYLFAFFTIIVILCLVLAFK